jgi:hypothetical protein
MPPFRAFATRTGSGRRTLTDEVLPELVVDAGGATGRGRVTSLRLSWRKADPLAVTVTLIPKPEHPALPNGSWVVLRDFLRYGLEEPTGDGDVRLRPDPERGRLVLQLARGAHPCQVSVACDTVRTFLDATEAIVPAGEEAGDAEIDALIARLLDR